YPRTYVFALLICWRTILATGASRCLFLHLIHPIVPHPIYFTVAPRVNKIHFSPWILFHLFFFSSRRRHTRSKRDWSSDVCSSDLYFNLFIERKNKYGFIQFIYDSCTIYYYSSYFAHNSAR